jgi:threonine synthase
MEAVIFLRRKPLAIIRCTTCQQEYPKDHLPFRCESCGGLFDFDSPPPFSPLRIEMNLPGIWKYRHSFDLPEDAPVISLGEGNTPLVWDTHQGNQVGLKMESMNPSGSYKDRGTAVLASRLKSQGVFSAVEDSSGNAGASFAAYAARAQMKGRVFVPESASGPKRNQIERYGAELVRIPGPRSAAAKAVLNEVSAGAVYASHAFMPFGIPGIATIAYELWNELNDAPGSLIVPVGHGGLLLGIIRGFMALRTANLITRMPYFVGVQATACSPMTEEFINGKESAQRIVEGSTIAEGVRVRQPARAGAILSYLKNGLGEMLAIDEDEILPAYRAMARLGHYCEPTSALVWCALAKVGQRLPTPIILLISGSGLKYYPTT